MRESELADLKEHLDGLRERLVDTKSYLRGLSAVVDGLNRGAGEGLEVAVRAVQAVADELQEVSAGMMSEAPRVTPPPAKDRKANGRVEEHGDVR